MTYFETEEDKLRENKAIQKFVSLFDGRYEKLGPHDVDFKVYDSNNKLIAYAEVKGRLSNMSTAYPLQVACRKIVKLADKRLNPVIIWACDDGIIYGKLKEIKGSIMFSGRNVRKGSTNDQEMMVYYQKQKSLKYMRF